MCIRYHVRYGILAEWKNFLLIIGLSLMVCLHFYSFASQADVQAELGQFPGFFDYILYLFEGSLPKVKNDDTPFEVPVLWLLFGAAMLFSVSLFPSRELDELCNTTIYRYKSRMHWWRGKIVWNTFFTIALYVGMLCTFFLFSLFTAGRDFSSVLPALHPMLFDTQNLFQPTWFSALEILLLPLVIYISVGLLHMALSLLLGPIFAFIALMVLYIASSFFRTPFLFTNGAMYVRSAIFSSSGYTTSSYLILCAVFMILAVVAGAILFKRYDLLKKNQ